MSCSTHTKHDPLSAVLAEAAAGVNGVTLQYPCTRGGLRVVRLAAAQRSLSGLMAPLNGQSAAHDNAHTVRMYMLRVSCR